jgi:hypothetical protein
MKQNKETSCSCFNWGKEGVEGQKRWNDLTNVQCKFIQNCHYESPLYNKHTLVKRKEKGVFLILERKQDLLFYFVNF